MTHEEIAALIAELDKTLSGLSVKWQAAPEVEKGKWFALIEKGLDERLELMARRG